MTFVSLPDITQRDFFPFRFCEERKKRHGCLISVKDCLLPCGPFEENHRRRECSYDEFKQRYVKHFQDTEMYKKTLPIVADVLRKPTTFSCIRIWAV